MPSWPGDYHYDPCDRCGWATRFKQFPLVCACTTPDRRPHPPIYVRGNNICQRCGGDPRVPRENMLWLLREHIEEIQAEQADLQARATPPSGPPLQVADRYADGIRREAANRD
jgi:ribosomal protein S14